MTLSRVIISGGGTGGHIFPAIAIANEIRQRYPECHIHFVGALGKMEMEKVPSAGFEITGLPIRGFQRKQLLKNWNLPFKLVMSLWMSYKILKQKKPEVVIGVGGYASAAIGKAAQWLKIPTVLQEQNGYAGMTNKLLAPKAKVICVAYPNMQNQFPKTKLVLTGNPIREKIKQLPPPTRELYAKYNLEEGQPTLLVVGGSLGARTINESIWSNLSAILEAGMQIIWQTGKSFTKEIKHQKGVYHSQFIKEMQEVYALADIIVSRAGAISISELCTVGKPTIFIPSPNVAEDHQTKNAISLSSLNAAVTIKDENANNELLPSLLELARNDKRKNELSENIKNLAQPLATQAIVDEIEKVIHEH